MKFTIQYQNILKVDGHFLQIDDPGNMMSAVNDPAFQAIIINALAKHPEMSIWVIRLAPILEDGITPKALADARQSRRSFIFEGDELREPFRMLATVMKVKGYQVEARLDSSADPEMKGLCLLIRP